MRNGSTVPPGNAFPNFFGVHVAGQDNTIGGTVPGAGNVVSGNHSRGVQISNPLATGNVALLVTAKSVARFQELKERHFAEYYLVGTLTSILVAVVIGVVLRGIGL